MLSNFNRILKKILFTKSEQQAFLEDVANLIDEGVPAREAISTVEKLSIGTTKVIAQDILEKVAAGQGIAEGLSAWFSIAVVEIIRSGEQGGVLSASMKTAINVLSERASAFSSVISSITYPVVVLILGCVVSIFLKRSVFENFAAIKPVATWPADGRTLYHFASFIEYWWWAILLMVIALILVIMQVLIYLTGTSRKIIDSVPLLSYYRDYAAARFMQLLGLLLTNRISLKAALMIIQRNASPYLHWHLEQMNAHLARGGSNIASVLDTGLIKNDDMVRLYVMARGSSFNRALLSLGEQALIRNAKDVMRAAKIFGIIIMGLDAAFLAFMIFSVYGVGSFVAAG